MRHFLFALVLFSRVCLWTGPALSAGVTGSLNHPGLDVIYVNANVGEAAGGHCAFRFGETVFHYQFQPNGNFILVREPWGDFRLVYNELCNRSISISRIPLTPAHYEKLRYHFTALLIVQQQKLNSLVENRVYLRMLESFIHGQLKVGIAGLGFFDRSRKADPQVENLRNDIDLALGAGFRDKEKDKAGGRIKLLAASLNSPQQLNVFLEQLTLQAVLQVLEFGSPLADNAVIFPLPGEVDLSQPEDAALQSYEQQLHHSIISIINSTRPDRGAALLLQIARWLTVRRSLAGGRILTLDPFSDNARRQTVTDSAAANSILASLHDQLLRDAAIQRVNFCHETAHPEITYSFIESARGRLSALNKVIQGADSIRVEATFRPPSLSAELSLEKLVFIPSHLEVAAADLKNRISLQQQEVKKGYHYNLFASNCATELVRALNSAFENPAAEQQALGGRLEPNASFNFTPFMFYRNVRTTFNCSAEECLPARRLRQLQALYVREKHLPVWLRESNTVTSTIYEPRSEDTPFLFFTDDGWLMRPLEGTVNLGYAALHSLAGIMTLPFDGGGRVYQGLRGMFYSMPEIFFGNIRKGTYGAAVVTSTRATP